VIPKIVQNVDPLEELSPRITEVMGAGGHVAKFPRIKRAKNARLVLGLTSGDGCGCIDRFKNKKPNEIARV
jgi:hypothetical protein